MATDQQTEIINQKSAGRVSLWIQLPIYAVVLGLLVLVALQMRRQGYGPVETGQAPGFTLQFFDGYDGGLGTKQIALADLRGKVVVVNFWASWCKPCEQEAAELEHTWRHYKDRGVMFLGVDYVDTETEARVYLKRFDISYPNGPDLGTKISQAFRIRGVPETYIVDQNGKLISTKIGPTTQAELAAVIEPLLK